MKGIFLLPCTVLYRSSRRTFHWSNVKIANIGWHPEVVFLTVVFSSSSVTAVQFENISIFETYKTLFLSVSFRKKVKLCIIPKKEGKINIW